MGALAAVAIPGGQADERLVDRMLAAAPHRGSERKTIVVRSCALGFSERPGSKDGSIATDGGTAAVLVGRVDNLADLARRFPPTNGHDSASEPAAILIRTFRVLGDDAPNVLRGAFSGVVTDGNRMVFFRDHTGQSNLFYRSESGRTLVSTEAKQIVAGSEITKEPDPEAMELAFFGQGDGSKASLKGVYRAPKATSLIVGEGRLRQRRYWHPENVLETARLSADDVQDRFEYLFTQACERTFTGRDVLSLSGGIDSPTIAAYAARSHLEITGDPLAAMSSVYPSMPAVDETRYVRLVSEELGLPLHTFEHGFKELDRIDERMDLVDGVVARLSINMVIEQYTLTRDLGFQTILTGRGAEEVFDARDFLIPHLVWRGRLAALRVQMAHRRARGWSMPAMARELSWAFVPGFIAAPYLRRNRDWSPEWIDTHHLPVRDEAARPPWKRWQEEQVSFLFEPDPEQSADEICQAFCGIEERKPWVDVDLWEFFLSLPAEIKLPHIRRKELIRKVGRGRVPDAILDRRDKTLFGQAMRAATDYGDLRRWLSLPTVRMPGVDYKALLGHIDRQDLTEAGLVWATRLARVHAFLARW